MEKMDTNLKVHMISYSLADLLLKCHKQYWINWKKVEHLWHRLVLIMAHKSWLQSIKWVMDSLKRKLELMYILNHWLIWKHNSTHVRDSFEKMVSNKIRLCLKYFFMKFIKLIENIFRKATTFSKCFTQLFRWNIQSFNVNSEQIVFYAWDALTLIYFEFG